MSDLVERLEMPLRFLRRATEEGSDEEREFYAAGDTITVNEGDFWRAVLAMPEAASELTRLRKEVQELREAARPFGAKYAELLPDDRDIHAGLAKHPDHMAEDEYALVTFTIGDLRRLATLTGDDNAGK